MRIPVTENGKHILVILLCGIDLAFIPVTDTYSTAVVMRIGCLKNDGTASSMRECVLMKFRVRSGNVLESFTHCPGLGSGTWNHQIEVTYQMLM